MQDLLQYQSKSYYIIGQEVYYSIAHFITLSGSYYIIGRFFYYIIGHVLQYRAFIKLSVGTATFQHTYFFKRRAMRFVAVIVAVDRKPAFYNRRVLTGFILRTP